MLKGKRVVLGVTGSIAAYKIANLASALETVDVHNRLALVNVIKNQVAANSDKTIFFSGTMCIYRERKRC